MQYENIIGKVVADDMYRKHRTSVIVKWQNKIMYFLMVSFKGGKDW